MNWEHDHSWSHSYFNFFIAYQLTNKFLMSGSVRPGRGLMWTYAKRSPSHFENVTQKNTPKNAFFPTNLSVKMNSIR